jgi:DNA-binding CsgD family transcriptional regulator
MQRIANRSARIGDASLPPHRGQHASPKLRNKRTRFAAQDFVLCEIPTQVVRSRVPAERDGSMPAEYVAGMLVMHCLTLNRRLEDFEVLVVPQSSLPRAVIERAQQLLTAGRSIGTRVRLGPQEEAVLNGVVRSLSNKEIASNLSISLRTVKFHVSALLAKFNVPNRTELGWRASLGQTSQTMASASMAREAAAVPSPNHRLSAEGPVGPVVEFR